MSRKYRIEQLAEAVVYEFLERVDPSEKRWPIRGDKPGLTLAPLRKSLFEVIDAAISDWEITTAEAEGLSL